ncbi:aldehyde dehydrogenase family protein [Flavobacterium sp. Fl-318]|uniref:Aldehyde dehydrogenase family protein n=1 Tax=Flavobacterium cupriresistens TaxID=2893885 RepID=A0ABU4RHR9_9FLAO|nr:MULTISPECIES: aldehyde dehydrogenase family protein [unclassified Flavobacterium]MDX6192111.1 aldehyde dehydrogenase family protein [Flavobacterium sp. Fl-318]UFH44617.1 aldehyde dehydrogenase family protein [Flavobacterium sp. F-323]
MMPTIDEAIESAVNGRMWNAGQVCTSSKRIIVKESIGGFIFGKSQSEFDSIKARDPMSPETTLAPLSSEKVVEVLIKQVRQAVKEGATLLLGGKRIDRKGAFMEPTLLTNIKLGNFTYIEEIFGPVFMFYRVKNEDEAVALANANNFGLGRSVFSGDEKRALNVARQIETGMVYINHLTGITVQKKLQDYPCSFS